MKRFLIIYHSEDNDGVCSAAIVKHYLMTSLNVFEEDIELLPATYNLLNSLQSQGKVDEWPKEYGHIIMTDISFNDWKTMKKLHDMFQNNFTWIDHHAPIIELSKKHKFDDVNGIRDISNSAIYNMYKYLYDPFLEMPVPFIVKMLSAWDSWTYEREGIDSDVCRKFNRGFTIESGLSVSWYMKIMDVILDRSFTQSDPMSAIKSHQYLCKIYGDGRTACDREDLDNKEMIRVNGDKSWTVNGIPAIMVVTTGSTNSMMFKSLQKDAAVRTDEDLRVAIVCKHCNNGSWTISLYNIYDFGGDTSDPHYFHCGKYLQENYNGGGHEGAAGCTVTVDKFCNILKSKQL